MESSEQQQQKELEEVIKSLPSDVVNDLLSLGLCVRCIFRVFRVEASSVYAFTSLSPTYDDNNKLCTLCLGILQFRFHDDNNNTNVPLLISDMVKRQGYHSHHDSFSLEIIIPSIILNNDNTLRQYIKIKYGFKDNTTFISAKDAFNFSLLPPLQTLLGGRCNSTQQDASFHIRLTYTASKDDNNNNNKRRKTDEHNTTFTTSLQDQSSHCCKFLLETANQPCHFTYSCYRTPLYFGGRYLKYSRNVSQSRWIIDDERMGEASVEEIIGENILQACQADSFKFHAAGREDIDVRMLGPGRPFLVEVKNARQVPSELSVKDIEKKINTTENKLVRVKNMKLVGSQGWDLMREGEAEKQKQYAALVWISRPLKDEDLQHVTSLKDLKVMQKTPIRVLHRRSPLEREKIIHWMKLETIAGSSQYFLLHLCTQAGTYIKEFVHGDLGRTHPSIGSMLGCRAEILQLDVTDIKMECFLT